jgi:tetratricopeptide (TPR) repeat protein
MKKETVIFQVIFFLLNLSAIVLISACTTPTLSQFEVQRPSIITVPRELKKVYIREDLITANNDKLGIKSQLLQELARLLNNMGRFKVSVVKSLDEKQFDAEKESVAVIQGEVISGGEVDRGQFTDVATCTGGIGGRISSAAAAAINKEAVTLDNWRGYVCRRGALASDVTEIALSSAFAMAGLGETIPPKNQVVRIYKYKNLSLFAQSNFSFTIIGLERETLTIRADSANFGRSIIEKGSYRNIKESHLISLTLGSLISSISIPIFPIPSRELAVAKKSNPGQFFYNNKPLPIPNIQDLPKKEKNQLIKQLVNKTLISFIRTISPYKVKVNAEIATGGEAETVNFFKEGKTDKIRELIEGIPEDERESEDWYNLGLAYEASALSPEDYEDARRFYIYALEKKPGTKIYAQGVGRTRSYLAETRKLAEQLQN